MPSLEKTKASTTVKNCFCKRVQRWNSAKRDGETAKRTLAQAGLKLRDLKRLDELL